MVNESWLAKLPGRGKEMERWGQRTGLDFSDSDVDLDHAKKDLWLRVVALDNVTASFPLHQNHPSKHTPPSQKLKKYRLSAFLVLGSREALLSERQGPGRRVSQFP